MAVVMEKDIAKLVLKYLREEKLDDAANEFCKASPHLTEEYGWLQCGYHPFSISGVCLVEIIREHFKIKAAVSNYITSLPQPIRENVKGHDSLSYILQSLFAQMNEPKPTPIPSQNRHDETEATQPTVAQVAMNAEATQPTVAQVAMNAEATQPTVAQVAMSIVGHPVVFVQYGSLFYPQVPTPTFESVPMSTSTANADGMSTSTANADGMSTSTANGSIVDIRAIGSIVDITAIEQQTLNIEDSQEVNTLLDTPGVRLLKELDSSLIKFGKYTTPAFVVTPGRTKTPVSQSSSQKDGSCYNRATKYPSGSSYYKPDESGNIDKNIDVLIKERRAHTNIGAFNVDTEENIIMCDEQQVSDSELSDSSKLNMNLEERLRRIKETRKSEKKINKMSPDLKMLEKCKVILKRLTPQAQCTVQLVEVSTQFQGKSDNYIVATTAKDTTAKDSTSKDTTAKDSTSKDSTSKDSISGDAIPEMAEDLISGNANTDSNVKDTDSNVKDTDSNSDDDYEECSMVSAFETGNSSKTYEKVISDRKDCDSETIKDVLYCPQLTTHCGGKKIVVNTCDEVVIYSVDPQIDATGNPSNNVTTLPDSSFKVIAQHNGTADTFSQSCSNRERKRTKFSNTVQQQMNRQTTKIKPLVKDEYLANV